MGLAPAFVIFITLPLALLGLYAMIGVHKYFGKARAAGGDHFDQHFREMSLVKQGIVRLTFKDMYSYAFLLLWAIPIGINSSAALVKAGLSHVYIRVHFFATEKPDLACLYGGKRTF